MREREFWHTPIISIFDFAVIPIARVCWVLVLL